ncbi:MAG: hypothetical protein DRJ56_02985 [Thermoprotei archaeon]|nr:MAG: hypothetical protein DRJ56_02985 [Thermoprotei archaeon]
MDEELSYEEIRRLCERAPVAEAMAKLREARVRRRGSKRVLSDVLRLAELSREVVRSLERAGRLVVVSDDNGIRELIVKAEVAERCEPERERETADKLKP